jgi:N-acyl-D-amino-acid deacylase
MSELVVKGGLVVDGTGGPAYRADVAVTNGRIEAIGQGLVGERVLDADGLAVSPGFFDLHTHYDAQVLWDPLLTPSSFHGVTSVVAGNTGFTLAPCRPDHHELVLRTLERVEDMPYPSLSHGVTWNFESYGDYLDVVARRGTAINFGGYVGHTAVRIHVMGEDAYERTATEDEVAAMCEVVATAIAQGAVGFSTSNIGLHRGWNGKSVPSNIATHEEIVALMRAAAAAGAAVIQMAPQDDIDWFYELQPSLGCNITWSALLVYPGPRDYRVRLGALRHGRTLSEQVYGQVTCVRRPAVGQDRHRGQRHPPRVGGSTPG